jgi:predicted MFS family arabinose efflux permease
MLLDKFFAPRVALILFALTAAGLLLLAFGGAQFAIVAAICIGCSIGGETDLIPYFTVRYFGMRAYGKIYGLLFAAFTLGMALSAVFAGLIYDNFGSYFYALVAASTCLSISCIVCFKLPLFPNFDFGSS